MNKEINNNIKEVHCSFEVSKLLKEKGFSWNKKELDLNFNLNDFANQIGNSKSCYNNEGKIITPKIYNPKNEHYPRPTLDLAIEWIRVNWDIHIIVLPSKSRYIIVIPEDENGSWRKNNDFKTPQEAKEMAILYTLKNLI